MIQLLKKKKKNPPANAGDVVSIPEDPLEEGMVTHSSILAGEIPWTEEPGRLQSMGVTKSQTGLTTHTCSYGERLQGFLSMIRPLHIVMYVPKPLTSLHKCSGYRAYNLKGAVRSSIGQSTICIKPFQ